MNWRSPFLNAASEFVLPVIWIFVHSSVKRKVLSPAIFDTSLLDQPTSCRHVMLARLKERGPSPGKPQPTAADRYL